MYSVVLGMGLEIEYQQTESGAFEVDWAVESATPLAVSMLLESVAQRLQDGSSSARYNVTLQIEESK